VISAFKDHFSSGSDRYATYRPDYPAPLFTWLAGLCPEHESAWDCATGSGQAALGLAPHFRNVVATDASTEQVRHAQPHPRIGYRVAPAEASGLPIAASTSSPSRRRRTGSTCRAFTGKSRGC